MLLSSNLVQTILHHHGVHQMQLSLLVSNGHQFSIYVLPAKVEVVDAEGGQMSRAKMIDVDVPVQHLLRDGNGQALQCSREQLQIFLSLVRLKTNHHPMTTFFG